jgi:hypothetical protein
VTFIVKEVIKRLGRNRRASSISRISQTVGSSTGLAILESPAILHVRKGRGHSKMQGWESISFGISLIFFNAYTILGASVHWPNAGPPAPDLRAHLHSHLFRGFLSF